MGRLINACGQTVDGGSDGVVTSPCDCDCEGCCCQYLTFTPNSGNIRVDADWRNLSGDLLTCLGSTLHITTVGAWYDECPDFPADLALADYLIYSPIHGVPIEIPVSGHSCVTVVLFNSSDIEKTRCTVHI